MSDLKELIEREMESFIEWDGDDKSIVTTTSAKLFAEHVAKIYADHVAGARKMVAAVQGEPVAWMTHHDEPMFFETAREASAYCDHDENPIPLYAAPQPAEEIGEVVVTKDKLGNIVSVTRQDTEGRVLSVIAESEGISQSGVLAEGYFQEHQFPSSYPVSGNVCFRESTGEWVLEITASINGAEITARHTQPAETRPEDVVGLPALYESTPDITKLVEALRMLAVAGNRLNDEAEECTYDDGVAEVASVDFWGDFREALEAADAALAPYRKRGDI